MGNSLIAVHSSIDNLSTATAKRLGKKSVILYSLYSEWVAQSYFEKTRSKSES